MSSLSSMQSSSHSPAVLCAFDVGHRHFVCVTLDNRIKLWDTHTGNLIQQYSEPQHLAAAYTSLAWTLSAPLPPPKKRASSSSSSTPQLGYLALGGRTGAVTVLNLSTGEFAHASASSTAASASASSAKVLAAPVLAVAFHAEQKLLLASSADAFVHRFSFPSLALLSSVAAPHPVTLIPPAPHSSSVLVALGPALHLVDLSSPSSFTVEKHWAAAAGDLCSVAATTDGALYATASNDRFVQLWSGSAEVSEKKRRKPLKALATLTLQAPATQVAITQGEGDEYHVAVLEEQHTVNVFSYSTSSSSPPTAPSTTLTLPPSAGSSLTARRQQVSILAHQRSQKEAERHNQHAEGRKKKSVGALALAASTAVESERGGADGGEAVLRVEFVGDRHVMLVRGERERPSFERVEYVAEDGEWKGDVVLERREADGRIEAARDGDAQRRKRSHDVTVLPTSSAPLSSTASSVDAPLSKKQKLSAAAAAAVSSETNPLKPAGSSLTPLSTLSSTLPLLQRTLAERLAEMERSAGTFAGDLRVKEARDGQDAVVPKAGSLQTLLTQALHTGDDALLDYCLSSSMASVLNDAAPAGAASLSTPSSLRQTLQRLPAAYLLPLLTRLTALLHSRPSRALPLLTWLHTLLLTQTPALLAQPPAVLHPAFSRLMGLLDSRVASYKKMCRLQGKLELIMAQVDGRHALSGGRPWDEDARMVERLGLVGPRAVYSDAKGLTVGSEGAEAEQGKDDAGEVRAKAAGGAKKRRRRRAASNSSAELVAPAPEAAHDHAGEEEEEEDNDDDDNRAMAMNGLNGFGDADEQSDEDEDD